eukprot:2447640-Pyramimonas_sp.AAC.1
MGSPSGGFVITTLAGANTAPPQWLACGPVAPAASAGAHVPWQPAPLARCWNSQGCSSTIRAPCARDVCPHRRQ